MASRAEPGRIRVADVEDLGYHIVRRGPIWDAAVRVSLIKTLT